MKIEVVLNNNFSTDPKYLDICSYVCGVIDIIRATTTISVMLARGAKEVVINWNDEITNKLKFLYASDDVFDTFPEWLKDFYNTYSRKGAAFLGIAASDPELMKGVDPKRMMRYQKVAAPALEEFRDRQMTYQNAWTVASVPTKAWLRKFSLMLVKKKQLKNYGK